MTPKTFLEIFPNTGVAVAVALAGILGFVTFNGLFLIWLERKVAGRFQLRPGPDEVGWAGTLQTLSDVAKLVGKQLITPRDVDRPTYLLAPAIVFVPVIAGLSLFPIDPRFSFQNLNVSLVLVFTFAGLGILGIFMAGWGSNNKYALIGAIRSVSQNIAYEIPLFLSALAIALVARSMNFNEIVSAQSAFPFLLVQPVGFLIYLVSAVAETNRAPFDIPEAESELIAGFHTEYSGMRFAMFFLAEFTNVTIVSMVAVSLWLGGYSGPFLPGWLWFFLKVYAIVFVIMWFRWTFPRLRFDQLMNFAWGVLIPLSIVNLLVTAIGVKVLS
jgi:NADH-quinone oxidoreductase subunit H